MDEARRFLRYVCPGVLFGFETILFIYIICPKLILEWGEKITTGNPIGIALSGLVLSGGLGFIFSVIYHQVHWCPRLSSIDYTNMIRNLIKEEKLSVKIVNEDGGLSDCSADKITFHNSHIIQAEFWYSNLSQPEIKETDVKVSRLLDVDHSIGTDCVASIFSFLFSLWLLGEYSTLFIHWSNIARFVVASIISLFIIKVFWNAYRRVGLVAQSVVEQIMSSYMIDKGSGATVRLFICDLECVGCENCKSGLLRSILCNIYKTLRFRK